MFFTDYFEGGSIEGILGISIGVVLFLLVWSLIWKGLALWHAARRGEKVWFVVFLIVNTIGILEIIYLFGKVKFHQKKDHLSIDSSTKTQ